MEPNRDFFNTAAERSRQAGVAAKATRVLNAFKRLQDHGKLNWTNMQLESIPSELFQYIHGDLQVEGTNWWEEDVIRRIDISNNDLKSIDVRLAECADLEELNFSSNRLQQLPHDVFSALPVLKKLDLQHNNIRALPDDICECPVLVDLNVSDNQILIGLNK